MGFTLFKRDSGCNLQFPGTTRFDAVENTSFSTLKMHMEHNNNNDFFARLFSFSIGWLLGSSRWYFRGYTLIPPPVVPNCNFQRLMRYQTKTKWWHFEELLQAQKSQRKLRICEVGRKIHSPSIGAVSPHDHPCHSYIDVFSFEAYVSKQFLGLKPAKRPPQKTLKQPKKSTWGDMFKFRMNETNAYFTHNPAPPKESFCSYGSLPTNKKWACQVAIFRSSHGRSFRSMMRSLRR